MRRNETVLVYAVTGVLLVILAIAVIFGEEPAQAGTDGARLVNDREDGRGLIETTASDLGVTRVSPPETSEPGPGDGPKDAPKDGPKDTAKDDLKDAWKDLWRDALRGDAPRDLPTAEGGETKETQDALAKGSGPGVRPGSGGTPNGEGNVAPVPLVTRTIAEQVNRILGTSRREGNYRVVTARSGDSLSTLVERWCGKLDDLALVEALNEDLKPGEAIPGGRTVLVPWTDDEVLLVAFKQRKKELVKVEAAKGELYTIKKGDSLWKIAVGRVGSRQAPAYIRAIVASNPQLKDPDAVRQGQKIRLPPPHKVLPMGTGSKQQG